MHHPFPLEHLCPHAPRAAVALRHGLWRAGPGRPARADANAAAAGGNPLLPRTPHFPGQGQARHPPVHERRAVARRHVRPQAGAQRSTPARRCPAAHLATERPTGAALRLAVQVPQVRPERHRGQRAVSARRPVDRRHRRDPLDARRRAQPRAVAAAHELRRRPADSAQPRLVAHLRPGHARTRTCRRSSPCAPAATRSRKRRTGSPASCPASIQGTYIDTQAHGRSRS